MITATIRKELSNLMIKLTVSSQRATLEGLMFSHKSQEEQVTHSRDAQPTALKVIVSTVLGPTTKSTAMMKWTSLERISCSTSNPLNPRSIIWAQQQCSLTEPITSKLTKYPVAPLTRPSKDTRKLKTILKVSSSEKGTLKRKRQKKRKRPRQSRPIKQAKRTKQGIFAQPSHHSTKNNLARDLKETCK